MKLLLDEMWTPTIAVELRKRDLDVIYALDPPFNHHRGNSVIGDMVRALDHFLRSTGREDEPFHRAHYLRAAPGG